MLPDHVLRLASKRISGGVSGALAVEPIEKGGSGRRFFRVRAGGGSSLIVISYTDQREENRHYVDIARFLGGIGVNVPAIIHHDPSQGLVFMEDLGETDLWHFRNAPWEVRRPYYRSTIEQVVRLHARAAAALPSASLSLQMEFDEPLYLWEQNYFFEHCLGGVFGLTAKQIGLVVSPEALRQTACRLGKRPRVIVHRDLQSQNVLIDRGCAWLIDFQGMRPGIPQYDLASLLYDPYVNLAEAERRELVGFYKECARESGMVVPEDFDEVLDLAASQRLMQAMGAYGFLGVKAGRPQFLSHVSPARTSLEMVTARIPALGGLCDLLRSLPAAPAFP